MNLLLAALLALLVGCYPAHGPGEVEPAHVEGQDEAVALVLETYGAPAALGAPWVRWRRGAELDCGGQAWAAPGLGCVDGLHVAGDDEVQVALPAGVRMSSTSLTHELAHWLLYQTTGDHDDGHRIEAVWARTSDALVWRAEAALLARGL